MRKMHTHTARFLDSNSPWSPGFSLQVDLNRAVNMFSSLLPRRSNESVTGGFMVKPLVQSHCKELRSMQLGTVIKCWAPYQKNAHGMLWRWQSTPKPQIALASHVLVEIGIRSSRIFREWLAATNLGSMQLGAVLKSLAAYAKNAHSHGTFSW